MDNLGARPYHRMNIRSPEELVFAYHLSEQTGEKRAS